MHKCLLFDCDGTLVESELLCNVALAELIAEQGVVISARELMMECRGWKLSSIFSMLAQRYELDLPASCIPRYRQRVSELFQSELKPIDCVVEALEQLPLPKAVVSSGPLAKIKEALSICELTSFFDGNLYSSYEVGVWKPDPDIYRYAAHGMGYDPCDCAVIDDGLVGLKAGVGAGIPTYFYNPFKEVCQLDDVVSFSSMSELPALLQAG